MRLSPHGVSTFRDCRQRYKFHYVDRLSDQYFRAKPYFTMGNHVHATLRELLTRVPTEYRTAKTTEQLLRRYWQRCRIGFKNEEDEKRWAQKALHQLQRFVAEQDMTVQPLMVEASLEAEISPQVTLLGRIDRVDIERDGTLHIIDYKTGNTPEELDWSQLYLYALLLRRKLPYPVHKVSFCYLSSGTMHTTEMLPKFLDQTAWEFLVTAKEIYTEKLFRPTPGPSCKRCDFRTICPARQPGYSGDTCLDLALWRNQDDTIW